MDVGYYCKAERLEGFSRFVMGFLLFPDLYFNSLWSGFSNVLLFVLGQRPLYFVTLKLEPSSIISYSLLSSVSGPPASFHILFYFQYRTLRQ